MLSHMLSLKLYNIVTRLLLFVFIFYQISCVLNLDIHYG